MYKIYFKQAVYMLKSNPLLSIISIMGTALAICMIMVIMILYEVNTADMAPEVNRSRSHYINYTESLGKGTDSRHTIANLGLPFIKECLYTLSQAEMVTVAIDYMPELMFTSTVDKQREYMSHTLYTDDVFWRVFQFRFIDGRPYNEAETASNIRCAVITESLARRMFGTEKAVGKELRLSHVTYTVTGVVKDVSPFADKAYAEIWLPHTLFPSNTWNEGINGHYRCTIIVRDGVNSKALKEEIDNKIAVFNSKTVTVNAGIRKQPFDQMEYWMAGGNLNAPNMLNIYFRYGFLILILLLIPALNLSGIILSQIQKRQGELGVRRAYGAKSKHLLGQVITENALQTLLGGFLGWGLSYAALYMLRNWLLFTYSGQSGLTIGMFSITVFLYAFLFCMVMNLLAAGFPAWKAAHSKVVDSLNTI